VVDVATSHYYYASLAWTREAGSHTSALVGRRTQCSTIGDRAFAAAAPAVWNSLPEDVRPQRCSCSDVG